MLEPITSLVHNIFSKRLSSKQYCKSLRQIITNAVNMSSEVGETFSFESSALNGLRGFAAIHILIYHSVIYSSWGFQIYGQVSTFNFIFSLSLESSLKRQLTDNFFL